MNEGNDRYVAWIDAIDQAVPAHPRSHGGSSRQVQGRIALDRL